MLLSIQKQIQSLQEKISTSRGRSKSRYEKELEELQKQEIDIQATLEKFQPSMTGKGISSTPLYAIPFVDVLFQERGFAKNAKNTF